MAINLNDEKAKYAEMLEHVGHKIECVTYGRVDEDGKPDNVAIECEDCGVVLVDQDFA